MTEAPPSPRILESSAGRAEVHDQGAQVTRWAPAGADPVLYVSTDLRLAPGRSIRAGVPVCWPWFGPGRAAGMEPLHGFVRTSTWQLVEEDRGDHEASVTYRITSDEATSPHWPHRYAAELRATFGRALEVSLTTTNTGDHPFDYEEALHAYLVVGDVHAARIEGLAGKSFFDKVIGTERVQQGDLVFEGETDAVFRTSDPVTLHDPALGRRLVVTTEGARNIVVWNPWAAKAKEVPDIGDDDWERFVCIEGANAFENAVVLAPGESHTTTYRLEVQPL
ncbi:MAG TPA: D-hexose-6-phosphate mutarotase [Ornithinibacter sp.]|nr:D-hexose-6-phosphate mutarotase [Ornithinibacter sp.]